MSTPGSEEHFVEQKMFYKDRVGGNHAVKHHPSQRWVYFTQMRRDEALLLKVMDSKPGVTHYTAHTTFVDPTTPVGAAPRESIEARVICFFQPSDVERTALPFATVAKL